MTDAILMLDRVSRALTEPPSDRNEDDLVMIMNWFKDLSRAEEKKGKVCVLGELDDGVLKALVKDSVLETWETGRILIKQGNTGDFMYIILSGECEVRVSSNENSWKEGDVILGGQKEFGDALGFLVGVVGPGSVIGEVALVKNVTRTANVIVSPSTEACTLIRISRDLFNRTLQEQLRRLEQEREDFTNGFHLVSNFNPKLRQQFIRALMKEKHYNGDIIVRQGDKIEDIYFIVSGDVILYLNPNKLVSQYELHLQAKNVYSILPEASKKPPGGLLHRHVTTPRPQDSNGFGSPTLPLSMQPMSGSTKVIWSCVSKNGMLGDFEVLAQLPSRMTTAVAQTETVLFRMNLPEFRRLVIKEGRETDKEARSLAKTALRYRNGKRREKLDARGQTESEVSFVDYLIRAIDQLAMPT
ncbi:hypothetical protein BOX15_Mlig011645g2 [Macrostomum lignano]|uniref:Cyclic nucleotide-binding domain-containing protein n=1 Tax=Macrostomum lignano TaxID=282301 RepID=A0A267GSN8_9PLAT|nr:hypothetical protein BOX15_Mlig011645g1 [Macrostomum lignano]PAA89023.1 hypothetical protein BOX15_Mlig011645g2 [Macrostomum lignano]